MFKNMFTWITRHAFWYFAIPLIIGGLTYGPYLIIQCGGGMDMCWRVPVAGQVVFDLNTYFSVIGRIFAESRDTLSGAFGMFIRFAAWAFPSASVPEIWLMLRWTSGVVSLWLFAWMLECIIPTSKSISRWLASGFWVMIFLSLGFRPGIYSWVMPFTIISFCAAILAGRSIREMKILKALLTSGLAVIFSIFYSWTFVTIVIWLGAIWMSFFLETIRLKSVWQWLITVAFTLVVTGSILWFFPSERLSIIIETLLRNGMAFTRMPIISTMLVNAIIWVLLLVVIRPLFSSSFEVKDRGLWLDLSIGWFAALFGWISNIFTGAYVQNDHFRMPLLLMSFITFAALAVRLRDTKASEILSGSISRKVFLGIFVISGVASLKYLSGPYAINGDQFAPIHVFVWLSLAVVSSMVLWPSVLNFHRRWFSLTLIAVSVVLGVIPYQVMFFKEARRLSELKNDVAPMIKWIDESVPVGDHICADPEIDEMVSAFSKRFVFFTLEDTYASMPDNELYRRVGTLSSLVNPEDKNRIFDEWADYIRRQRLACSVYARDRAIARKIFGERFSVWSFGCDVDQVSRDERFVASMYAGNFSNIDDVRSLCSHLAIPSRAKSQWLIAAPELVEYDDGRISIYRIP